MTFLCHLFLLEKRPCASARVAVREGTSEQKRTYSGRLESRDTWWTTKACSGEVSTDRPCWARVFVILQKCLLIGLIAPWFTHSPGQESQDQAGNAGEEKGQSPTAEVQPCDDTPDDEANQNAYQ